MQSYGTYVHTWCAHLSYRASHCCTESHHLARGMCDSVSILVGLKSPFMLWDKCLPWAIETMDPKKLKLLQVSHAGEGASWWGRGCLLEREFTSLKTCQTTWQDRLEPKVLCPWWVEPDLDQH